MATLTKLRTATFRGVAFEVDAAGLEGGRRVQVHEYPQRDEPFVEDLGRATRGLSFQAFVVGTDYIDRAKKLIEALEAAGPGELVHPWLGTLQVAVKDNFRVSYSRTGLGVATFDLSFVEGGKLSFPAAGSATPSASRAAADALNAAGKADFDKAYKTKGLPDFVSAVASGNWQKVLGTVGAGLPGLEHLGLSNRMADVADAALNTTSNPGDISSRLISAMGLTDLANNVRRWNVIANSLTRLSQHSSMTAPAPAAVATPSRTQATLNLRSTNALMRQVLLAQAVGASSLMTVSVYDDAIATRQALLAALDAELLQAGDAAYAALQAARAAVWRDLTTRARSAARLRAYTPTQTTPALVLAYGLYGDAARADEIVARNRVRHPGFVPPVELQVLSS